MNEELEELFPDVPKGLGANPPESVLDFEEDSDDDFEEEEYLDWDDCLPCGCCACCGCSCDGDLWHELDYGDDEEEWA